MGASSLRVEFEVLEAGLVFSLHVRCRRTSGWTSLLGRWQSETALCQDGASDISAPQQANPFCSCLWKKTKHEWKTPFNGVIGQFSSGF